jgi:hypothetical protein
MGTRLSLSYELLGALIEAARETIAVCEVVADAEDAPVRLRDRAVRALDMFDAVRAGARREGYQG